MLNEGQARPRGLRALLHRLGLARDAATRARQEAAHALYIETVKQARTPALFTELGVPDTPEGRFETIALHVAMVVRRLRREGPAGDQLAQELFDLMFGDMDENLRIMGVGDLSVGKYVKRLARNFYARLEVLDRTLGAGDGGPMLRSMLETNVYHGSAAPSALQLDRLIGYLETLESDLAHQPGSQLLAGRASFPVLG